jgi:L-aspartate oxidase
MKTDILIVGSGCAGLYCALNLPDKWQITIITKDKVENSDSFLAQGGMCMLKSEDDYESYFEDTMKAGHYENNPESVEIMIRESASVVKELVDYGADFHREADGSLSYTKEGAHSHHRIIFHEDVTGKEITSTLLARVKERKNITIYENLTMLDILCEDNCCYGAAVKDIDGKVFAIYADYTVLACGGIGGLYRHSTNFRHLTGDGVAVALKHNIATEHVNYVQIHPTTLYSPDSKERSFLISESVRGEGALLYNKNHERFVDELLPRDLLTEAIRNQMKKDGSAYVYEDMSVIDPDELREHFPNIVQHCKEMGYDVFHECIPVVPAQHYFMGGIKVDMFSKTSCDQLYAIGETACNGVHGRNRLASNSLLESLVFARRAAGDMAAKADKVVRREDMEILQECYNSEALEAEYKKLVLDKIDEENNVK